MHGLDIMNKLAALLSLPKPPSAIKDPAMHGSAPASPKLPEQESTKLSALIRARK